MADAATTPANVLSVADGLVVIGERKIEVVRLQRTNKEWHSLESAVKANKQRLSGADVELLERIVLGESTAAQNGWNECKQALAQAGLL